MTPPSTSSWPELRSGRVKKARMSNSCSCRRWKSGYKSSLSSAKSSPSSIREALPSMKLPKRRRTAMRATCTCSQKLSPSLRKSRKRLRSVSTGRRTWSSGRISAMSSALRSRILTSFKTSQSRCMKTSKTSARTCRWTHSSGTRSPQSPTTTATRSSQPSAPTHSKAKNDRLPLTDITATAGRMFNPLLYRHRCNLTQI